MSVPEAAYGERYWPISPENRVEPQINYTVVPRIRTENRTGSEKKYKSCPILPRIISVLV
ncbi:MAG: hypothetical protein IPP49_02125 [Saprospiraceae bacterium]|nr:hypothetical protein [Saprospiraceae bacterium]